MKEKEFLTIAIPTFNRPSQLAKQLSFLVQQDLTHVYEIIVVNNNSNYDIQTIINQFENNKIRLVMNPFNIGMATNMIFPFLYCKTKWIWLLSDDDEILLSSISKVVQQIQVSKGKVGLIKFSINDKISVESDTLVNSLDEFINYYYKQKPIRRGPLVFISTNVFNLEYLGGYIGKAFEYSYTHIGFLVPVILALNDKKISVQFSSERIVKYQKPEEGNYSFSTVGKGLSTLSHLPLKKVEWFKFLDIFMSITPYTLFRYSMLTEELNKQDLNLIYFNSYKFYLSFWKRVLFRFFILIYSKAFLRTLLRKLFSSIVTWKKYK